MKTFTKLSEFIVASKAALDQLWLPAVLTAMRRNLNPETGLYSGRAGDLAAELGTNRKTLEGYIERLVTAGHVWHVERATDSFGKPINRNGRQVSNGYFPWKFGQVLCFQECGDERTELAQCGDVRSCVYDYSTQDIGCRASVSFNSKQLNPCAPSRTGQAEGLTRPPTSAISIQSVQTSQRIKALETDLARQVKEFGLGDSITQRTDQELARAREYLEDLARWKTSPEMKGKVAALEQKLTELRARRDACRDDMVIIYRSQVRDAEKELASLRGEAA